MTVSAQVAIYPLRQERLTPAISAVRDVLNAAGLGPVVGPMSTTVTGEADRLCSGRWSRRSSRPGRSATW